MSPEISQDKKSIGLRNLFSREETIGNWEFRIKWTKHFIAQTFQYLVSCCARAWSTLRAPGKNRHIPLHYTSICNRVCHGDCACNVYITRSRFRRWRMYAYPVATFVHARDARSHYRACTCTCIRVYGRDDSHGELCALCCARGHDNSAEKPRNICPAAINSETAPTFLANLHKTVTYHSIIRPIRPRRPFTRLTSPGHRALPPFSRSPFLPFSPPHPMPPGGSDRVLSAVFFRALHFPQFPTNPLDVTGMRGRKRTLCDRVTRYGAANSTLACFRPNYNTPYLRTINFHFSFVLPPSLSLSFFFIFTNVITFLFRMFQFNLPRSNFHLKYADTYV